MAQIATMNQAQLQILDMLSFIKTPEALSEPIFRTWHFFWRMKNKK